jgi:hypothetical protein
MRVFIIIVIKRGVLIINNCLALVYYRLLNSFVHFPMHHS